MSLPMPVIAFGPSPATYFVAVGMKYYAVGMPDSVRSTASKWPAPEMRWMRYVDTPAQHHNLQWSLRELIFLVSLHSINAYGAWMAQDMYSSNCALLYQHEIFVP